MQMSSLNMASKPPQCGFNELCRRALFGAQEGHGRPDLGFMPELGVLSGTGYLTYFLQAWASQLSGCLSHPGAATAGLSTLLLSLGLEVPSDDHVQVSLQGIVIITAYAGPAQCSRNGPDIQPLIR